MSDRLRRASLPTTDGIEVVEAPNLPPALRSSARLPVLPLYLGDGEARERRALEQLEAAGVILPEDPQ